MKEELRVAKKCPVCGHRLFDKISLATGYVEIKCHRCGSVVRVNLALRRPRTQAYSRPSYKLCS